MATHDLLETLRSLLGGESGFTLVLVLGAGWHRNADQREVIAREVAGGLELTPADPMAVPEIVATLDPHVEVTRDGDRIRVSVR